MTYYLDDQTTSLTRRTRLADAALHLANMQVANALAKTPADKRAAKANLIDAQATLRTTAESAAEVYRNEMVDRISAQDGKTVMKCCREDIGGPCDPGMERYWTM
jgi:hypothetical protein